MFLVQYVLFLSFFADLDKERTGEIITGDSKGNRQKNTADHHHRYCFKSEVEQSGNRFFDSRMGEKQIQDVSNLFPVKFIRGNCIADHQGKVIYGYVRERIAHQPTRCICRNKRRPGGNCQGNDGNGMQRNSGRKPDKYSDRSPHCQRSRIALEPDKFQIVVFA